MSIKLDNQNNLNDYELIFSLSLLDRNFIISTLSGYCNLLLHSNHVNNNKINILNNNKQNLIRLLNNLPIKSNDSNHQQKLELKLSIKNDLIINLMNHSEYSKHIDLIDKQTKINLINESKVLIIKLLNLNSEGANNSDDGRIVDEESVICLNDQIMNSKLNKLKSKPKLIKSNKNDKKQIEKQSKINKIKRIPKDLNDIRGLDKDIVNFFKQTFKLEEDSYATTDEVYNKFNERFFINARTEIGIKRELGRLIQNIYNNDKLQIKMCSRSINNNSKNCYLNLKMIKNNQINNFEKKNLINNSKVSIEKNSSSTANLTRPTEFHNSSLFSKSSSKTIKTNDSPNKTIKTNVSPNKMIKTTNNSSLNHHSSIGDRSTRLVDTKLNSQYSKDNQNNNPQYSRDNQINNQIDNQINNLVNNQKRISLNDPMLPGYRIPKKSKSDPEKEFNKTMDFNSAINDTRTENLNIMSNDYNYNLKKSNDYNYNLHKSNDDNYDLQKLNELIGQNAISIGSIANYDEYARLRDNLRDYFLKLIELNKDKINDNQIEIIAHCLKHFHHLNNNEIILILKFIYQFCHKFKIYHDKVDNYIKNIIKNKDNQIQIDILCQSIDKLLKAYISV